MPEQLKKDFADHVEEDRAQFQAIHKKLDKLLVDVITIKGQWKLVGAILGVLAGLASGWIFGG